MHDVGKKLLNEQSLGVNVVILQIFFEVSMQFSILNRKMTVKKNPVNLHWAKAEICSKQLQNSLVPHSKENRQGSPLLF